MQRQRQTRMAAEQQVEVNQRQQMEALRQGFAPEANDLDVHVKQAAAFRSGSTNRPYQDVLEEERLDEGSRRAVRFQKSIEGLTPLQQAEFGVMAAGLQKEGLPASEYQRILEAVRSGQPLDKFSSEQIEKANRIYRATEGEDLVTTDEAPERDFLLTDLPGSLARGVQQQDTVIEEIKALGTASEYAHSKGPDVEQALAKVLEVNSLTEEEYDALSSDDRIFAISQALVQPFPGASNAAFQELTFRERPTKVRPLQVPLNVELAGQEAGAVATTAIRVGAEELLPGEGRPSLAAFQEGGIEGAIERSIDETITILGVELGPRDLLNPLNLIPLPIIDPLIARLISIPVRFLAHTGGRVTTQIARILGREAADKAADETLDAATRAALRNFSADTVPTTQGAPLETVGVRRGLNTGDTVALVSDPSTSVGRIIAQSEQGVTIRPEGGGKPFLRSRERVQAVEDVLTDRPSILDGAPDEEITLFRGLGREGDELIEGAHLTPNRQHAQVFADADARLTGGEARVVEVRVRRSVLDPIDVAESPLAASQGAVQLRDPSGARVVQPGDVSAAPVTAQLRLQAQRMRQQAVELRALSARGRQQVANEQQAAILEAKASALLGEGPPLPDTLSQFPARAVEPGAAPTRVSEPSPRAALSKAGTPEFRVRSSVAKARLQAILDDPSQPKSVKQNAKKHLDKVCA